MVAHNKNYYEILEIPTNSKQEEINLGFMRAKNAYSKDSLALYSIMSKQECEDVLNLIEEAYSIISDPEKRKQYDQARGINSNLDNEFYGLTRATHASRVSTTPEGPNDFRSMSENILPAANDERKPAAPLAKIVASRKFTLEYDENPEFEKEIEATNEFSGEFLKRIREYKNVDIIRMAEMTKVSKTYLRNIEDELLDNLPALVYIRGFIYQYAKCLKLNPDLVATSYLNRLKTKKAEQDT